MKTFGALLKAMCGSHVTRKRGKAKSFREDLPSSQNEVKEHVRSSSAPSKIESTNITGKESRTPRTAPTPPESGPAKVIDLEENESQWPIPSNPRLSCTEAQQDVYESGDLYEQKQIVKEAFEKYRGFFDGMRRHFPDSIPQPDYLDSFASKLVKSSYSRMTSAVVLIRCRESGMDAFAEEVSKTWKANRQQQQPYVLNVTAPAGLIPFDADKLMAKPIQAFGVRKVVYLIVSHIAIGDLGELGHRSDPESETVTTACDDLFCVLHDRGPRDPTSSAAWDQYRTVHRKVKHELMKEPSLSELTRNVNKNLCSSVLKELQKLSQGREFEFMVKGLVLIHGPAGSMYVHKTMSAASTALKPLEEKHVALRPMKSTSTVSSTVKSSKHTPIIFKEVS
mmetsp:Transcript_36723/g.59339  ORF Transcript_36723/g.59339 Transcript_36723/m.59339 type:complete len:394 (-) Transcript_36723:247-1428(-)